MSEISKAAIGGGVTISSIARDESGLEIVWSDGHSSRFHYIWLRDCCYCDECGDCYSSKRFIVPSDLSLDIQPMSVSLGDSGNLCIDWEPDGHRSQYDPTWLRANCYDTKAREARRCTPKLWGATISEALPEVCYTSIAHREEARLELYNKLREFGFVVIRGGPAKAGAVEEIANIFGDLGENAYGKIFDLSPSSKIRTLGNTTRPVPPHTDEAFRHTPPGIMVLGCIRRAEDGGETMLVDGFKIAQDVRATDPEAFRLLATRSINFVRRHDDSLDQRLRTPIIGLDDEGEIIGVRIHTRSSGPLDMPADDVPGYYAAYHRLSNMMMDPAYQMRTMLEGGDFAVFDNHRVLHARTDFTDVRRHLQICSVSREQFHERYRLLAQRMDRPHLAELHLT